MGQRDYYNYLMSNTEVLIKKFDYDSLFDMGKVLPYRERITFDYKIICLLEEKEFFETVSLLKNEKRFLKLLIKKK